MSLPEQIFFDMNGTLFDPSVLGESLGEDGPSFAAAVLGDAVTLSMVATITDSFREFSELLEAAARGRLERAARPELISEVLSATRRMRPFPEAAEAIGILREAGCRVGVLTNSSTAAARKLIEATELQLDPVVGTDQVGAFKPDRRVYERGLEVAGTGAAETLLITAHWWDAVGAKRAGMQTGWISREEGSHPAIDPEPDFVAADLAALAEVIAS